MTDATPTATPAAPAATPSLGQEVDAEIVVLKARVAAIEAAAKTDWSDVVAWAKSNWAHIALTWPAAGVILVPAVKAAAKLVF